MQPGVVLALDLGMKSYEARLPDGALCDFCMICLVFVRLSYIMSACYLYA